MWLHPTLYNLPFQFSSRFSTRRHVSFIIFSFLRPEVDDKGIKKKNGVGCGKMKMLKKLLTSLRVF